MQRPNTRREAGRGQSKDPSKAPAPSQKKRSLFSHFWRPTMPPTYGHVVTGDGAETAGGLASR